MGMLFTVERSVAGPVTRVNLMTYSLENHNYQQFTVKLPCQRSRLRCAELYQYTNFHPQMFFHQLQRLVARARRVPVANRSFVHIKPVKIVIYYMSY